MESHHSDDNDMARDVGGIGSGQSTAALGGLSKYGINFGQNGQNLYQTPYDPSTYKHTNQPEYLFPEKAKKDRSFGEKMFYGTGVSYLAGQAIGGSWGLYEGLKHADGTTARLRINTVLNGLTKRGPFVANAFGVLAIGYTGINFGIVELRGGDDDAINQISAATLTGVLYKATGGMRRMALAGAVGAIIGTTGVLLTNYLFGEKHEPAPTQAESSQSNYA